MIIKAADSLGLYAHGVQGKAYRHTVLYGSYSLCDTDLVQKQHSATVLLFV